MTDPNHRAADLLSPARPCCIACDASGPTEVHGGVRDPVSLDLEDAAGHLRAMGVRCRLGEDGLWAGKLCLHPCGAVSVDGRVRGLKPARLGRGMAGFVEALRQVRLIPEQPGSRLQSKQRDHPWCRLPRVAAQRLKGRRAEQAIERMHAFLAMHALGYEQLGPGRFLICGRVYFNPPSGRVRLKGCRTHPVKGLVALAKVLAAAASTPELGHLDPPSSLWRIDPGVLTWDEPVERAWAGSLAARALAIAGRSRPARGMVAQED
jgi:hypothetical protein